MLQKNKAHSRILRILAIIRLLNTKNQGMDAESIAKKISISPRSVHRYIHTLREIGLQVDCKGTLYRVKKTPGNYSDLIDYLPELPHAKKKELPGIGTARIFDTYIYKGSGDIDYHVFDSIPALLHEYPVDNIYRCYRTLQKNNRAVYPNCQIIKARQSKTIRPQVKSKAQ
jgi:biotin operon repressor